MLAALTLLGGPPTATSAAQDSLTVTVVNIAFDPQILTISAGSTVTWVSRDPVQHTVTADDGSFDSGLFGRDDVFSLTFDNPGRYTYYCVPHGSPNGIGMAGVIFVVDAQ
ncbi:MAG: plastocyanin/azurin family copper-binding protein [Chloroflexota bacterium]|nr:plastocyanin/azurin family copper-binding protein [Chloroflexota bacterium]